MNSFSDDNLLVRLLQGVIGLLGLYALIRFLPRLVKSVTKRFIVGILGEILIVAATILVTERASSTAEAERAPADVDSGG